MKYIPLSIAICFYSVITFSQSTKLKTYSCLPCGMQCDKEIANQPGKCSHCGMDLVLTSTIRFKEIAPSTICGYIASHKETILLDVRTKEEYEGKDEMHFGTLKNAINIPLQQLEERLGELKQYRNREILVFCSHSHRSPQAAYMLGQKGFTKVANMSGGMSVLKDKSCIKSQHSN